MTDPRIQTIRAALDQLKGILRVHVLPADDALDSLAADLEAAREKEWAARRMLQALDAYWLSYEGLPKGRYPRGRYDAEDWWHRFEKYRAALARLSAGKETGR